MESMKIFFEIFTERMNMVFYGVDIIVDSRTGVHYIVDCNYLSNYADVPMPELIENIDGVLERLGKPKPFWSYSKIGLVAIGAALLSVAAFLKFKKRNQ